MTVLDNTQPILIEGKWSFLTYSKYQAIEEYAYQSLPGPSYGCPASASEWLLESGELPPGLHVEFNTGIVKGTVQNILGSNFLVDMLSVYPDEVDVPTPESRMSPPTETSPPSITVSPTSYGIRPSTAGPDDRIIVTYTFSIRGYDYVVPPTKIPGTLVQCSISVLKNWRQDVENWKQSEPYYQENNDE